MNMELFYIWQVAKKFTMLLHLHILLKPWYTKWCATVGCKAKDRLIISNMLKIKNLYKVNDLILYQPSRILLCFVLFYQLYWSDK